MGSGRSTVSRSGFGAIEITIDYGHTGSVAEIAMF
jgi:hypothetical protein